MGKRMFSVLLALCLLVSAAPAAADDWGGFGFPGYPEESRAAPQAPGMRFYILMYHSIVPDGSEGNSFTTTESQFRADLQWITQHGYTTVLPGELAAGKALPARPVLITFDDGYADNYSLAFPLLQEFGARAVVSPVVRCLEREEPGYLSWEMCREMLASGLVEFGTHTYNQHQEAGGVSLGIGRRRGESRAAYETRVFTDIETSVRLLESNLGCKVDFFAYPFGQTDVWSGAFLRERFSVTVTTVERAASVFDGLYELPRYNINSIRTARSVLPA